MVKQAKNYLDLIPVKNDINTWDTNAQGTVTIHMVHRGVYAWIAQTFFHRPRISHIDLDQYGSFLWQQIDGKTSVGQLAQQLHDQFGQNADPLYDRLVKYMQILRNNRFILFCDKDRIRK